MKQQYQPFKFKPETMALITTMNTIIASYMRQGFVLTVRQLYYQLVARAVIPNTEESYKRTTSIVNDARLAGEMDWDGIEDRTRSFVRRTRWDSGAAILKASSDSYHMDMWHNQEARVFVIIEKEALAGVLEGVCHTYDVPLLAARGYPSGTVLRAFAEDDLIPTIEADQDVVILHLGDHDPSGIDMTRDLDDRLSLFMGSAPILKRIALTMAQIRQQNPPPNPAKVTDARFKSYEQQYGSSSWELDALDPTYLINLVETNIKKYIDADNWKERREEIDDVKKKIVAAAKSF